jgi:hypothetical protein
MGPDQRHKLHRVGDVALPDVGHGRRTDQIDPLLPPHQQVDERLEPRRDSRETSKRAN